MTILQARQALRLPDDGDLTPGQIKRAYRSRTRETHPDHGGSTEDFQMVAEAFAMVQEYPQDPAVRQAHTQTQSVGHRPEYNRPVWTRQHTQAADAINLDDLLDDLRTIVEPPVAPARPRVRILADMQVEVSGLPPGARVLFGLKQVIVLDADGEQMETDIELVAGDAGQDVVEEYRQALRR